MGLKRQKMNNICCTPKRMIFVINPICYLFINNDDSFLSFILLIIQTHNYSMLTLKLEVNEDVIYINYIHTMTSLF